MNRSKRIGRPPVAPEIRFMRLVRKTRGCWYWIGATGWAGYGKFTYRDKQWYAHRAAYEMFRGSIPNGQLVCHHCDRPRCVKPDHLFTGTVKDNAQDAVRKGRHSMQRKAVIARRRKHR